MIRSFQKIGWTLFLQAVAVLFVYAAIIKLMDPVGFQIKLLKSSYIPVWAIPLISAMIPWAELMSAGFLVFESTRKWGWMLVYFFMILFDGHLVILHLLSPSAPCSCGGLLESLSFSQHLGVNFFITVLAAFRVRKFLL